MPRSKVLDCNPIKREDYRARPDGETVDTGALKAPFRKGVLVRIQLRAKFNG
jgi:hypothetical protein